MCFFMSKVPSCCLRIKDLKITYKCFQNCCFICSVTQLRAIESDNVKCSPFCLLLVYVKFYYCHILMCLELKQPLPEYFIICNPWCKLGACISDFLLRDLLYNSQGVIRYALYYNKCNMKIIQNIIASLSLEIAKSN